MSVEDVVLPEKFNVEELIRQAAARAAEAGEAEGDGDNGEEDGEDGLDGSPSPEKLPKLPQAGSPYKAHARPANRSLETLCFIKADGTVRSYPYSCRTAGPHLLPAGDAAKSLVLILRFSDADGFTEIHLIGRRLEDLMNLLCYCRIAWIREQARGKFVQDGEPVVTGIVIHEHRQANRKKKAGGKDDSQ